jgi:hypothetical protein
MPNSNGNYDASYIFNIINKEKYCWLNTISPEGIESRIMTFASDNEMKRFYFLSFKVGAKVSEIKSNPNVTLAISPAYEKLEDCSQTTVIGKVTILNDFKDPSVQEGFRLVLAKDDHAQMLFDSGTLGDYVMMRLDTKSLSFGIYRDLIRNLPKTIIRF